MRARLMHACPKLGHYSAPVDVDLSQADIDRVIAWWGEGSIIIGQPTAGPVVLIDAPLPVVEAKPAKAMPDDEPEAIEAPKRKPRR
jgi:hypothetical protein